MPAPITSPMNPQELGAALRGREVALELSVPFGGTPIEARAALG